MYPAGEERGSALVQESLESRNQDAELTHLLVKLEKKRPKSKVKLPSKIWHFCYNYHPMPHTCPQLDLGPTPLLMTQVCKGYSRRHFPRGTNQMWVVRAGWLVQ